MPIHLALASGVKTHLPVWTTAVRQTFRHGVIYVQTSFVLSVIHTLPVTLVLVLQTLQIMVMYALVILDIRVRILEITKYVLPVALIIVRSVLLL